MHHSIVFYLCDKANPYVYLNFELVLEVLLKAIHKLVAKATLKNISSVETTIVCIWSKYFPAR